MFTSPYKLENFEGPLELLLHLVERGEINALEIALEGLTLQLTLKSKEADLDENAESLFLTSSLLFLKSQRLLPHPEGENRDNTEALKGEIIAKIVELYQIREKAHDLAEQLDSLWHKRGRFYEEKSRVLALPTLQDLQERFLKISSKKEPSSYRLEGPTWQLKEQASWLKRELFAKQTLSFREVFDETRPIMERIVTFLAALELFRCQEIFIEKRDDGYYFRTVSSQVVSSKKVAISQG